MVPIIQADVVNGNGRLYPAALLQKVAREYRPGTVLAYSSQQIDLDLPLTAAGGVVRRLAFEHDRLYAEIDVVANSEGRKLEMLMDAGIRLVATGIGTVENGVVTEDYQLQGIVPNMEDVKPIHIKSVFRRKFLSKFRYERTSFHVPLLWPQDHVHALD